MSEHTANSTNLIKKTRRSDRELVVIRVTGGIGSGKSTFCNALADEGAVLFNADATAKQLMSTDPDLKSQIVDEFGDRAYSVDGKLNRAFIASLVFTDSVALGKLNDIVHPAVFRAFDSAVEAALQSRARYLVYEAALLTDRGEQSPFDLTVVVDSAVQDRIVRVQRRDNVDAAEVSSRVDQQPDRQTYLEAADYVVTNDGSLDQLAAKAGVLLQSIENNFLNSTRTE